MVMNEVKQLVMNEGVTNEESEVKSEKEGMKQGGK